MRKSKFRVETLLFSLAMAAGLMMPSKMCAQSGGADGFFNGGSEFYENRDGEAPGVSGSISNDSFGAPLGSGLIVMVVAGVCYAVKKRRPLLMLLLVLCSLTQCKKNVTEVIPYQRKAVAITLEAGGTKTNVNPVTGAVDFVDGDEIVVANNGVYVGLLTYEDGVFSGTITSPSESDYLHFYHLGNRNPGVLEEGESTGCSVSIADQVTSLPVISYAPSTVRYSSEVSAYAATLRNKCALVKFDVTNRSPYAGACVKGMNNKVTIDFSDASFSYGQESEGELTLASGSGERWAVLLPQGGLAAGGPGSAFSGTYSGTRGAVPEITEGAHVTEGITVDIETPADPEGALSGLFTVNSDGRQVRFSTGNLVFGKNTGIWNFYTAQNATFSTNNRNVGENYSNNAVTVIEHYGWGSTGFKHGAVNYSQWMTGNTNSCYYAYGDVSKNLCDETGLAEWGHNAIANGGNAYKQWRTLTADEFEYLINERDEADEKYAYATVKNVGTYRGFIVLPDDWTQPVSVSFTPGVVGDFTVNNYTYDQWSQMEAAGAVFLVAAGRRDVSSTMGSSQFGMYWTSSCHDANTASCFFYNKSGIIVPSNRDRAYGCSVRLVIE